MHGQQVLGREFSNVGSMCLQDGMHKVIVGPRHVLDRRWLPIRDYGGYLAGASVAAQPQILEQ
jgi:hypothetical protein